MPVPGLVLTRVALRHSRCDRAPKAAPALRRRALKNAGALGLAWLLGACATVTPAPENSLAGRLALTLSAVEATPARQFSAAFELRGSATRGELDLISPLGPVLARARWWPAASSLRGGAQLVAEGQTRDFASLDDLALAAFGETLPIAALFDWLRGQPWPDAPSQPLPGASNITATSAKPGFSQLGWQVQTEGLAQGRLEASRAATGARGALSLRIRLEDATGTVQP